jgi:hypothetical protein
MSLESLTPEEIDDLESVLALIDEVQTHFVLRDRANAQLHLARVIWSPITKATFKAKRVLYNLLYHSQDPRSSESNANNEINQSC